MNKKLLMTLAVVVMVPLLGAAKCQQAADKASENLSKAADNFEIDRIIPNLGYAIRA